MSTKKVKKPAKKAVASKKETPTKVVTHASIDLAGLDKNNKSMGEIHIADITWGDLDPELIQALGEAVAQFIGVYLGELIGKPCKTVEVSPCCKKKCAKSAKKTTKKKSTSKKTK